MFTKLSMPSELITISSPEIVKAISSPSASVAITVPIAFWFSAALKTGSEVNSGSLSLTLLIVIEIVLFTVSVPSVRVSSIEYEFLVS